MKTTVTDSPNARPAPSAARATTTPTSPAGEVPKAPPANDNAEVVEAVLETGERTLIVGAWRFAVAAENDTEPRVRDLDAAERLGFKEPRMIRKLIKRIWPENQRPHVRDTVERTSMPRGGEREYTVSEFWLTEAELLMVCARAETPIARAILDDMIRVYLAVRRFLLAHPVARPVPPELLDRPAIRVDARLAAHPAAPIAEDDAPRVTTRRTGDGFSEREELTVLGWTFARFAIDPKRAPRELADLIAARLGIEARRVVQEARRRHRDCIFSSHGDHWIPSGVLREILPALAKLDGVDGAALAELARALDLIDAHVAERAVYVRAHHRRRPGALRASLAVAPVTVDGVRFHTIRRDGFYVALADEDLRAFLAAWGVPIEGWARAKVLLMLRSRSCSVARRSAWTDAHGEFYGLAAAEHFIDALVPEDCPAPQFDAVLDAVEAIYTKAEHRAAKLVAAAQGAGTLADAFVPRRLDSTVRALPA